MAKQEKQYDVMVVGGGPGGYVAAIRAAQLGLSTAVVEEKRLGGICLNWGCIPTKALLKGAEVAQTLRELDRFGFSADNIRFDIGKLVRHSRSAADKLAAGVGYLMKKNGVDVIEGRARLAGKCRLQVQQEGRQHNYRTDHIILATGARPRELPGIAIDGERVWSYFEAMVPESLPESLLVIGSGAIGVEFASLYNDLGVDVTLVEVVDRILPAEDPEIAQQAQRSFARRGIRIHTGTRVSEVTRSGDTLSCRLQGDNIDETLTVERAILAVGVQGNIEDLGLEDLGVETANGFIKADEWGRTNVVGLYAIGDVAGPPCLAHKASHEGVTCVEKLAGVESAHALDKNDIPACTYCRPQVASIGLTQAEAESSGRSVKIGRFDLAASGKAVATGDNHGLVKTVFDAATGELLGAHMFGPEVTEQIQGFGIARTLESTEEELARTVFPHPTVSEAMHEAVLDAMNRPINQ
ncbi:MAG TPA: dihydrolipoyl dehydrogenase [Gammaproteobacteria bacterium]|nr:dihydrolipoyl dehydrogenase [Gammaproteobacteria bacterium]